MASPSNQARKTPGRGINSRYLHYQVTTRPLLLHPRVAAARIEVVVAEATGDVVVVIREDGREQREHGRWTQEKGDREASRVLAKMREGDGTDGDDVAEGVRGVCGVGEAEVRGEGWSMKGVGGWF